MKTMREIIEKYCFSCKTDPNDYVFEHYCTCCYTRRASGHDGDCEIEQVLKQPIIEIIAQVDKEGFCSYNCPAFDRITFDKFGKIENCCFLGLSFKDKNINSIPKPGPKCPLYKKKGNNSV